MHAAIVPTTLASPIRSALAVPRRDVILPFCDLTS